jgi:hypothetical protein
MSDNTYIVIDRDTFRVSRVDADTGQTLYRLGQGKSLEQAVDLAQKEMDSECPPEYGIVFEGGKGGAR